MSNLAANTSSLQTLPPKEASLFKKLLKHFKDKQFKNGIKVANQILSNPKFSEHGETLSMKGLILNSMGKKAEAMEYVKRGLKSDVKSNVCWHVFGLLQKAEHRYEEAVKCYRNALRLKKDSIQILSDLSLVQIQTRDLEGYRDSRYQLFLLRPSERSTWLGCAMAHHLAGDSTTAVKILNEYLRTNPNPSTTAGGLAITNRRQFNKIYEQSELMLYTVFILMESKRYEEAFKLLDDNEQDIVDKVAYYEYKAETLLQLNKLEAAQTLIQEELIKRNPENVTYTHLLERAKQVTSVEDKVALYDELAQQYPRSQTIAREPLNFALAPDLFRHKISVYLQKGFRKGQPALFRDLKHLYATELSQANLLSSYTYKGTDFEQLSPTKDLSVADIKAKVKELRQFTTDLPAKIGAIESLLFEFIDNLRQHGKFALDGDEKAENAKEPVTCLLWVYFFLAQHFDALKEFTMAIYFVNLALHHTPTLIDIFVIKAKIFKHAGHPEKATSYLEEAQSLDTSDRYLNSKCAKYLIRINKVKEAEDMCLKFTRENVPAAENLNEMQCMWFQNAMAGAYQRLGSFGEALKKCVEIDNHFADIQEDQFDFNTYCILKVTLRAYVQMIRLEDKVKSHKFFVRTANTAVRIYLSLYDNPAGGKRDLKEEANAGLSSSELRKLRNKQRKAALKAEKENLKDGKGKAADSESKGNQSSGENQSQVVDGDKLAQTKDPLADAFRFLTPLKVYARNDVNTHSLSFELYYRKGKLLLQLQSLKRLYKRMDNVDEQQRASILRQTGVFLNLVHAKWPELSQAVQTVLQKSLSTLPWFSSLVQSGGDKGSLPTLDSFLEANLSQQSSSLCQRVERLNVEQARVAPDHGTVSGYSATVASSPVAPQVLEQINKFIADLASNQINQHLQLETAQQLFTNIEQSVYGQVEGEVKERLRVLLNAMYPYAVGFMSNDQVAQLEVALSATDHFTAETVDESQPGQVAVAAN